MKTDGPRNFNKSSGLWNDKGFGGEEGKQVSPKSDERKFYDPAACDKQEIRPVQKRWHAKQTQPGGGGASVQRSAGMTSRTYIGSNQGGQSHARWRRNTFQVRCYSCNKYGHVRRDCKEGKKVVTLAMCDTRSPFVSWMRHELQKQRYMNER